MRDRCRPATPEPRLTIDELVRLARAFAQQRGRDPTMDELRQLDAWATRTRLNYGLLSLVLKGAALLDLDADGAPTFLLPDP